MTFELDSCDVLFVCGSGGVGKTSLAAAVALDQARAGRRVCVLTIDPARRLADAMGLSGVSDRPRRVPVSGAGSGSLSALMLDPKRVFDRLVEETSPDGHAAERILANRIYQQVSASATGVQEYMAIERLYELDRTNAFDLIVVDTPPAAHAREFLEGPGRLLAFLQGRSLRWLVRPGAKAGKVGVRALSGPGSLAMRLFGKVTGAEAVRDIAEFFGAFDGMYDAFTERIALVDRMLSDPRTGFLLVTSPEREAIDEAILFWELLCDRQLRFVGSIVNRVEPDPGPRVSAPRLAAELDIETVFAKRLQACQRDHAMLASRDAERVRELRTATAEAPVACINRLPRLSSDMAGISTLATALAGEA